MLFQPRRRSLLGLRRVEEGLRKAYRNHKTSPNYRWKPEVERARDDHASKDRCPCVDSAREMLTDVDRGSMLGGTPITSLR